MVEALAASATPYMLTGSLVSSMQGEPRSTHDMDFTVDGQPAAMYIHCMVRTQLYLDEAMHARLRDLARKQGRTVSDLVREALARVYAPTGISDRIWSLHSIEGLCRYRSDLGYRREYVRELRRDTRTTRSRNR